MTPDLNVILAAARSDHPQHRPAFKWLNAAVASAASGGGLVMLPMVLSGYLRLSTNGKVFRRPTPPAAAMAFVDSLLAMPGVEIAELGKEWPVLRRLVLEHGLHANDVPDAWIAAAVQTLGDHLVTFDRGFVRWLGRSELTLLHPT